MEFLEKFLKKTGWSSLLSSVIFAILGIILIANPEETVKVVSYILGGIFILTGIIRIINYIVTKGRYDIYNDGMFFGIIAIVLGIVTICYSKQIGNIFRVLIGVWIVYSAIVRMDISFKLKALENKTWLYSLIIAIVMLICGIYIACNPGAILVTIGIVILIYSILDIIESIIFLKDIKKLTI